MLLLADVGEHSFANAGITGPLCVEFTCHRWIPLTKASDAELWWFLWSGSEATVEQIIYRRRRWFEWPRRSLWLHCNDRWAWHITNSCQNHRRSASLLWRFKFIYAQTDYQTGHSYKHSLTHCDPGTLEVLKYYQIDSFHGVQEMQKLWAIGPFCIRSGSYYF